MTLPAIAVLALATVAFAALRRQRSRPLDARIDARLPQTQCRQCGYDGCRPYAEAIAAGEAINRCPPGGERVIRSLAALTGREPLPLDVSRGVHKPRQLAYVDEGNCIGCTLCIQACPVDAIVGAPKLMHTVLTEHCTGCELCLPACPVDCILLEPRPQWAADLFPGARRAQANDARRRYERRNQRLERERREHAERMAAKVGRKAASSAASGDEDAQTRKRAIVEAALQRARTRVASLRY